MTFLNFLAYLCFLHFLWRNFTFFYLLCGSLSCFDLFYRNLNCFNLLNRKFSWFYLLCWDLRANLKYLSSLRLYFLLFILNLIFYFNLTLDNFLFFWLLLYIWLLWRFFSVRLLYLSILKSLNRSWNLFLLLSLSIWSFLFILDWILLNLFRSLNIIYLFFWIFYPDVLTDWTIEFCYLRRFFSMNARLHMLLLSLNIAFRLSTKSKLMFTIIFSTKAASTTLCLI